MRFAMVLIACLTPWFGPALAQEPLSEMDEDQICGIVGSDSWGDLQRYLLDQNVALEVAVGQARCHTGLLAENRRLVGVFHKSIIENAEPRDFVKSATVYLLENSHRDIFVGQIRGRNSDYINIFEEMETFLERTAENRVSPIVRTGKALCRRILRYEVEELYDLHAQHCTTDGIFESG